MWPLFFPDTVYIYHHEGHLLNCNFIARLLYMCKNNLFSIYTLHYLTHFIL